MIEFTICEDTWTIVVLDDEDFQKKSKEDLAGFTDLNERAIIINADDLNLETVIHELTHAYFYYTCTGAACLDKDVIEEIWCELLAVFGEKILKKSKKLLRLLKKEIE